MMTPRLMYDCRAQSRCGRKWFCSSGTPGSDLCGAARRFCAMEPVIRISPGEQMEVRH